MSQFIYTGGAYYNLGKVGFGTLKNNNQLILHGDDGAVIDDNNVSLDHHFVSIIPPQGEWICIFPVSEEDGSYSASHEPVLGWALTALGNVVPVTPTCTSGNLLPNEYALHKRGFPQVYAAGEEHRDENEWLLSLTRNQSG